MKNIAIFVSSTFSDMQSERDIIREKIAPEVEDKLRRYGLNAEFIDLRWGIDTKGASEQAASVKIMRSCFDEIKRTEPYFVVLLGERYGWVPSYEEIYAALASEGLENNDAFKDKSVTEIEIAFAREFYSRKDKCIFYFRSPVDYGEDASAREMQVSHGEEADKLNALKEILRENYPEQIKTYEASWDGANQSIVGLENFENALLADILSLINDEYGQQYAELDEVGESLNIQDSFIEQEAKKFSGRAEVLDALQRFARGDEKTCLVLGNSGSGKTALLARFAREMQAKGKRVVSCFAGISRYASSVEFMLKMLIREMSALLGEENPSAGVPVRAEELCDSFYELSERLSGDGELIIIIDAVNQFIRTELEYKFKWLNLYRLSNNVKIIFSCTSDYYQLRYLSALCDNRYKLDYFTDADIKTVACRFFEVRHKEINAEVLGSVVRKGLIKNPCRRPIYLLTLLQELNNIGAEDFREIERRKANGAKGDEAIVSYLRELVRRSPLRLSKKLDSLLAGAKGKTGSAACEIFVSAIAFSSRGINEKVMEQVCTNMNVCYESSAFSYFRKLFRSNLLQRENGAWDFNHSLVKEYFRDRFYNTPLGRRVTQAVWTILQDSGTDPSVKETEFVRFSSLAGHTEALPLFLEGQGEAQRQAVLTEIQDRRIGINAWRVFFAGKRRAGEEARRFLLYALNSHALSHPTCERLASFALDALYGEHGAATNCAEQVCAIYVALGEQAYVSGHYSYALDCYRMIAAIYEKTGYKDALAWASLYNSMAECHYAKGNVLARNRCVRKACRALSEDTARENGEAKYELTNIYYSELCRQIGSPLYSAKGVGNKLDGITDIVIATTADEGLRQYALIRLLRVYAMLNKRFSMPSVIIQLADDMLDSVDEATGAEIALRLSDYYSLRDASLYKTYLDVAEKSVLSALEKNESEYALKTYDEILDSLECRSGIKRDDAKKIKQERISVLRKIVAQTQDYTYVENYIREIAAYKHIAHDSQPFADVAEMKKLRKRLVRGNNTELQKLTDKMFRLTWIIILAFYFVLPQIPFAYMNSTIVQLFGNSDVSLGTSTYTIYCGYLSSVMQGTINTAMCLCVYGITCMLMRSVGFSSKYVWRRRTMWHFGLFCAAFAGYYIMWEEFSAELVFVNSFYPRQMFYTLMVGAGFLLLMEVCTEFAYFLSRERNNYPFRKVYRERVAGLPYRVRDYAIRLVMLVVPVGLYYGAMSCGCPDSLFMVLPQKEFIICVSVVASIILAKMIRDLVAAAKWRKYGKSV